MIPRLVRGVTKRVCGDPTIEANPAATDERTRLQDQLTIPSDPEPRHKPSFDYKHNANSRALEPRKRRQPANRASYTDAEEFGDEFVYVCQKPDCTRFMVPWQPEQYPPVEQNRWFITRAKDGQVYVRCPQHIDWWIFPKTAGNLKQFRDWATKVKKLDKPTAEKWDPLTPYPLDPKYLFNSDGTAINLWDNRPSRAQHQWTDEGKWE